MKNKINLTSTCFWYKTIKSTLTLTGLTNLDLVLTGSPAPTEHQTAVQTADSEPTPLNARLQQRSGHASCSNVVKSENLGAGSGDDGMNDKS